MKKFNLVLNYTVKQYKVHKSNCNNDIVNNVVNREFNDREHLEVVVSDLTYVGVKNKWHYICLLVNLFNWYCQYYFTLSFQEPSIYAAPCKDE